MQTKPVISPLIAQQLLTRALELLEAPCPSLQLPHSWIKGALAVDNQRKHCEPQSDLAVAYCELGAIQAVTYHLEQDTDSDAVNRYLVSLFNMANPNVIANDNVPAVNDAPQTDFDTIRRMFQKAIKACDRFIK